MDLQIIILYLVTILFTYVSTARILAIFPVPAKSHFTFDEAITRSLHDAGHHITIISPFPWKEVSPNYTIIDSRLNSSVFVGKTNISFLTDLSMHSLAQFLIDVDRKSCYDIMQMKEIQDILSSSNKQYDIMIIELFFMFECYLPLAEKLNIPVIGTITIKWKPGEYAVGIPNDIASLPLEMINLPLGMTFVQRIQNLIYNMIFAYDYLFVVGNHVKQFYREHFDEKFWYKKKVSLVFYNNHPVLLPRALPPNAIEVAGIHIKAAKPLPKDLQQFIDEAEHGVILFSLGSLVKSSSISVEIRSAFVSAFAAIPQRIIWKYEESIDKLPKNILLLDWLPQRDILEHENVKAFISHCGQSGVYEAIHTGTPIVATPLFTDQFLTAAELEVQGAAVPLDISTATTEKILAVLDKIINDTKYFDRMQELSRIFKDRLVSPKELVVYWTEYVLRYNGALNLRTAASDMPLYKYLLLDILIFFVFVVGIFLWMVLIVFKNCSKFWSKSKKIDQRKKYR